MRGPTHGQELVDQMKLLLLQRTITAQDFGVAMHHAEGAGVAEARGLGMGPGRPSGHYSRMVKRKLTTYSRENVAKLYGFMVASYSKTLVGKGTHKLTMMPLHEMVADDMAHNEDMIDRLDEAVARNELMPAYYNHRIVREELEAGRDAPVPLALFVDGVPYSEHDSIIGFWVINMITGQRFLSVALRKKVCCRCGCRAW